MAETEAATIESLYERTGNCCDNDSCRDCANDTGTTYHGDCRFGCTVEFKYIGHPKTKAKSKTKLKASA